MYAPRASARHPADVNAARTKASTSAITVGSYSRALGAGSRSSAPRRRTGSISARMAAAPTASADSSRRNLGSAAPKIAAAYRRCGEALWRASGRGTGSGGKDPPTGSPPRFTREDGSAPAGCARLRPGMRLWRGSRRPVQCWRHSVFSAFLAKPFARGGRPGLTCSCPVRRDCFRRLFLPVGRGSDHCRRSGLTGARGRRCARTRAHRALTRSPWPQSRSTA